MTTPSTRKVTTKPLKRAKATEVPVVSVSETVKAEVNSHVVFIRQQPPGATKAFVKAYGPIDRSTAVATLARVKRAYQKTNGSLEGFVGHALVLSDAPADA